MRLGLVAMPWSKGEYASAALGVLAAWVRQEAPTWEVSCYHPYVEWAEEFGDLYTLVANDLFQGEILCAATLYPAQKEAARSTFRHWMLERVEDEGQLDTYFTMLDQSLTQRTDQLARDLAGRYDLVGLTTSYGQLFGSLLLARRLRELDPAVRVVLGGATVGGEVGPSLLREYPFLDVIIQGEGELPLLELLEHLERGTWPQPGPGLLVRGEAQGTGAEPGGTFVLPATRELADLDRLPLPDYSAYLAEVRNWPARRILPVEGSRGCYWHRVHRTGDPHDACHFCSFNSSSYRARQPETVAALVGELAARHGVLSFHLMDNALHPHQIGPLTQALCAQGRDLDLIVECRGNIRPRELLALREAGVRQLQVGIEGLCTSYLRRLNKGVRAIDNLQAMRSCLELELVNGANLILGFPGATAAEIEETRRTIERYATAYPPLDPTLFHLEVNSTVYRCPAEFGVRLQGNDPRLLAGLPREVWERLRLWWVAGETEGPEPSWNPVLEAARQWASLHERLRQSWSEPGPVKPLSYRDGGDFLELTDHRHEEPRVCLLHGPEREILLYCTEIRSRQGVLQRFAADDNGAAAAQVLGRLAEQDLLFEEDGHCLALPVAARLETAIARLRSPKHSPTPATARQSRRSSRT